VIDRIVAAASLVQCAPNSDLGFGSAQRIRVLVDGSSSGLSEQQRATGVARPVRELRAAQEQIELVGAGE
jgi:hypothetical protein